MNSFTTRKIGTLGRVVTGKTPSTANDDYFGGPYPFITIPDLDGRVVIDSSARTLSQTGAGAIKSSLLPAGSVMMSCIATVGKCGITARTSFTNQQINSVIPNEDVDAQFLYYAFREIGHVLERSGGGGSVYTNVSKSRFSDIELLVPPLPEQRAIAATLGALDDKIELNRKMNATLESMARALFRDWFVDFGPTRAKMEGREPYLSPDLWSLFPDRLDAEGKPEGWEVSTIGDFIELLDHKRVPLSSQERAKRQGPYPYHGATSVMDHIDSYLFDERLLLLGEDGSVAKEDGRPFTQYVWGKLWVNNHAHVIKGRNMSVEQLKLFFDQIDIRPFVTGAVQPKLNQANLRRVPYLRASDAIHSAFDATIAPLYDLVRQLNEESRTLAQTRDLLLPRLMSGELRVAENERLVGEVA
ncbi:restriction endonuclease subunit S [Paracoccus sp. S1E-3]|uniref:restriction endonuclease subunit S n=1 Tax=Paracoccus sp. S1E-3 TaxID=2756130 RepID=UPI0015EFA09F|nr:restriction endonuclease subunit S [Paracoccus sp. S1E-3]MBA4491539.1 restriction endonuclease subunit S [Paracoccus sp. S1E-3]